MYIECKINELEHLGLCLINCTNKLHIEFVWQFVLLYTLRLARLVRIWTNHVHSMSMNEWNVYLDCNIYKATIK